MAAGVCGYPQGLLCGLCDFPGQAGVRWRRNYSV